MIHITDTRSQKVVSYTSAHITETVFAPEMSGVTFFRLRLHFCSTLSGTDSTKFWNFISDSC